MTCPAEVANGDQGVSALDLASLTKVAQLVSPGSRLLQAAPLMGGVSAEVIDLQLQLPDGSPCRLVLRAHGAVDRGRNPDIAQQEFRLLQALGRAGVPAPRPCLLDQSGELWPVPYLVVEYISGQTSLPSEDLGGSLAQMAQALALIHRVDPSALGFLPRVDVGPQNHCGQVVLLHGDFWPGNLLWQHGQLAGVIDWEDAALGDPLLDLANARLELTWAAGQAAAELFTRQYLGQQAVDARELPWWDLWVARRATGQIAGWGLPPAQERAMRVSLERFVRQAELAVQRAGR